MLAAALGALVAAAIGFWIAGDTGRDGFLRASRLTARWSFLWFVVAWSASALARLWPGGWRAALLFNRRGVGLGFATAHFIHAVFFITAIWGLGASSSPATVFGGGLGYVFVLAMAITSHDFWVRRLTPKGWKLLHTVGASYIVFIFAFTYYGRIVSSHWPLGVIGLGLIGTALALRAMAWAARRRGQAARQAA